MIFFEDYAKAVENYCQTNGLSYQKAKQMGKASGKDDLLLQYHDPAKGKRGLLDETPAPVVLIMHVVNGIPRFEQTEHTNKYLK